MVNIPDTSLQSLPSINHITHGHPSPPGEGKGVRLILTSKFPPAICGVGDHSAGLRNDWQQKGHRVIIANGMVDDVQQAVYRYPEKNRAEFITALVRKENITHVLWQYSPYAMHSRGTPWWVLGVMKQLKKMGIHQAIYFHEIQIRYSVPGWFNKLRAFQQHTIANRAVSLCESAGTSISFYLQYITAKRQSKGAKYAKNTGSALALSAENLRLSAVKEMLLIPVPPNIPVQYKQIITPTNIEEISEKYQPPLKFNQHSSEFVHPSALPPLGGRGEGRGEGGEVLAAFANRAIPSVVEALARVQQAYPDLDVVWLGHAGENDRAALQQDMDRFGLRARSTGTLPLEELAREIAQANLLLLPQPLGHGGEGGVSLKNGTLSAAMAAALPIIATRGDMTDTGLLQHGKNIHLLPDNEVESWQHAMEFLLQDTVYRNGLSQSGHAFYQSHLSWEVVGEAFEGLMLGEVRR